MIEALKALYARDLEKVKTEIALYTAEKNIWRVDKGITNSGGNLCLHLIGNLNAFIGVGLAKTDYVRQRELEFSAKDIPRAALLSQLDETLKVVQDGLSNLTEASLKEDFPVVIWGKPTGMEYTLLHLLGHLNYHLGQINYHRRLLDV